MSQRTAACTISKAYWSRSRSIASFARAAPADVAARALTPLVGRAEELDLLSRRWERARKGEGQLALIVGEPGSGKSRLIEEFRARLGETPHTWVEWSSSQLLQNTPLHPVAEWGRLRYGAGDTPEDRRLADLENTLQLIGPDAAEYAPLLGPLFDVPLPADRAAKFAPEELRRWQLSAMTAVFLAGARSQPIVLAFEGAFAAQRAALGAGRLRAANQRNRSFDVAERPNWFAGEFAELRDHLERRRRPRANRVLRRLASANQWRRADFGNDGQGIGAVGT